MPMTNTLKKQFLAALCAMQLAAPHAVAQTFAPTEYEIKAAFIHNIAKFVEWPAPQSPAKAPLMLCILGQDPSGGAFDALYGKQVGGMAWEVAPVNSRASLRECRVLFIAASEAGNLRRILEGIQGSAVLTVGDSDGFAEQGVMVNFYLEQNKVRFEINLAAVKRAGLKISSQLLKLARIIQPTGGEQ